MPGFRKKSRRNRSNRRNIKKRQSRRNRTNGGRRYRHGGSDKNDTKAAAAVSNGYKATVQSSEITLILQDNEGNTREMTAKAGSDGLITVVEKGSGGDVKVDTTPEENKETEKGTGGDDAVTDANAAIV